MSQENIFSEQVTQKRKRIENLLKQLEANPQNSVLTEAYSEIPLVLEELASAEESLRLVTEKSADQVFQQDMNLRYTWAPHIKGLAANLIGKTDFDIFPREEAARLENIKKDILNTGRGAKTELKIKIRDEERFYDAFFEPLRNGRGRIIGITGYIRDITDRKQIEKDLEDRKKECIELISTDQATGLYNLRQFYNQMKFEIERVNRYYYPLTVLIVDIEDFKKIIEKYGRYEGEKAIKRIADIVKGQIRQVDSAYRYGEQEFAVILPDTENDEALNVAERIRDGFEMRNFSPLMDERLMLTVSIGIVQYYPKEDMIAFLRRADKSLYMAKAQGRNGIYFQEKEEEDTFLI
jgi:diguanylate cyclase (GGDEF)-like protein/PAS domain S-box-containing protein